MEAEDSLPRGQIPLESYLQSAASQIADSCFI